jgi:alpha-ketoglutarate-dependent taurine dioxygenase
MIHEIEIAGANAATGFQSLLDSWADPAQKVFVLRAKGAIDDPHRFYDEHFDMIGTPAALAEDVNVGDREEQRTGDIWMEVRYDPRHPDAYRHSSNAQPLHTDGSYIPAFPNATLMACVANSGEGGETTFIDAEDVVAAMRSEDPDLLHALSSRIIPHARSGDRRDEKIIDIRDDGVWVNWNYYCVDREIDAEGRALVERFFAFLQSSPQVQKKIIGVKLEPGDAVTWKDRRVFHGRNGFVATHESERFLWKCAIDVGQFVAR